MEVTALRRETGAIRGHPTALSLKGEGERARERDKVMLTLRMCCLSCWEERRGKVYRHRAYMIKNKESIKTHTTQGKKGLSQTKSYRRNTPWVLHINIDTTSGSMDRGQSYHAL